jgi:hypothetical protein
MSGRHYECHGPSPTLGSLGPSHQWRHKSRVSLRVPLASMVLLLIERWETDILVVGDVLEHCLVVGSVLGVVHLEVCLITEVFCLG